MRTVLCSAMSSVMCLTSLMLLSPSRTWSEETKPAEGEQSPEKVLAKQRLELMAARIGQMQVRSTEAAAEFPERFESTPIFRYDDPARGLVSAGLWRLGAEGRPLAVISTELQPRYHNRPRIVYEFLSLTNTPFTVSSADCQWSPSASAVEFKPIPGASEPAANPAQRLVQMRTEAKRFTASEVVRERFELRLLPQPIERYKPAAAERSDGSMFILAFGLNPEAILFIETDGTQWQYAIGRLAGAGKMNAAIDGEPAWEIGPPKYSWKESYTASNSPADIPGIAADGSPLKPEVP